MSEVKEKIEEVKEEVTEKAEEIKEAVAEKVEEAKEAIAEKAAEVQDTVAEKVEEIKEAAPEKVEEIKEAVAEKAEEIKEAAAEKVEKVKAKVSAPAKADESMESLSDELEKSLKAGPPRDDAPVWDKFEQLLADKTPFDVKIDSAVKGGVVAFVDEVRAFIPASQLAAGYVENLEEYKGKTITVTVITADRTGKKLVLSGRDAARKALRAEREEKRAQAIEAIEVDSVLEGKIESLKDYGAFVDLGDGVNGLIHVSQISYKRVEKPADVLKEGQTVKVKVIGKKDGKISLSMKALEEAPKRPERPERSDRPEREDRPRGRRKEESVEYTEKEKASTSLADLLSDIKL